MGSLRHGALHGLLCRAAVGSFAAVALVTACGLREPALVNPGKSTANPVGSAEPAKIAPKHAADIGIDLEKARPTGRTFVSHGHFGGRWTADVAIDASALPIYTALNASSRFPEGSLLVKRHRVAATSAPGPVFVMTKHEAGYFPPGGDWEYVALDSSGIVEERGKLARCARCHAEGNGDFVFGLPADGR